MYRKLDDAALSRMLEAGIDEFALHGLDRASMSAIAARAGISVGVIYKYYEDKDSFFLACVRHSLELLDATLRDAVSEGQSVSECMERIVFALIRASREHPSYNVMYNEISSGSCRKYAEVLAHEIESGTAEIYKAMLEKAAKSGEIAGDIDPGMFAFFFDNLLMMLQFSYSCGYYRERMRIFCGADADNDEKIAREFTRFMTGALGTGSLNNIRSEEREESEWNMS